MAKSLLDEAEFTLGEHLRPLLEEPFRETDTSRENQIRTYLGSSLLYLVAESEGIIPHDRKRYIFGASAGETAGLMAAGYYNFQKGLRLASRRGEEMHKASIINPGAMVVASWMAFEDGEQLADEIDGVYAVNDNPGLQTVFSGSRVGIATLQEKIVESEKWERVVLHIPDIIEAAHTWHMGPAVKGLKRAVRNVKMSRPHYDFMGNQAKLVRSVRKAKKQLPRQLTRKVKLTQSADKLYHDYGVRLFVDTGQGKVLHGQMRRQFKHIKGPEAVALMSLVDELLPVKE
ncbi:MAG TPA: hypothetical protein VFW90_02660 [Candidatus Saccharimonadales bacterium]|nr:hypothetical protein [Candidatus Saccharimonadales bacterium]